MVFITIFHHHLRENVVCHFSNHRTSKSKLMDAPKVRASAGLEGGSLANEG